VIKSVMAFYILLYCTFSFAQVEQNASLTERVKVISDSIIKYSQKTQNIPGVVVSVVHEGELIFSQGYGYAHEPNGIAVDPTSTQFSVASISKTFTYTALMQLIEEGRLSMDDEVTQILDLSQNAQEFGTLKIRHLFTHTAGFEDGYLGHWMANVSSENPPLLEYVKSLAPKRVRQSDEFVVYSNYASALAGAVIEKVTGQPFKLYMLNNVLLPLGMRNSTFENGSLIEQLGLTRAVGHYWNGVSYDTYGDAYVSNGMTPAAGLLTTANDIAKFMIAHLEEEKDDILFAKTKKRMHDPLFGNHAFLDQNAHGFWTSSTAGFETLFHTGSVSGTLSHMVLVPKLKFGIFISANISNSIDLVMYFIDTMLSTLFPSELNALERFEGTDLKQYSGEYLNLRRNFSTYEGAFEFPITVSSTDEFLIIKLFDKTHRLISIGKHRFIDQLTGEKVVFQPKEGGGFWLLRGNTVFEPIGTVDNTTSFIKLLFVVAGMSVLVLMIALNRKIYSVKKLQATYCVSIPLILLACSFLLQLAMVALTINIQGPDVEILMVKGPPISFHIFQGLLIVNVVIAAFSAFMLVKRWDQVQWHIVSKLFHSLFVGLCISSFFWAIYLHLLTPFLTF